MEKKKMIEKLTDEYSSLKEKCKKLEDFLIDTQKIKSVGCNQAYLLDRQLDAMNLYLYFLGERIEDLEVAEEKDNTDDEEKSLDSNDIANLIKDFFHTDNSLDVFKDLKVSFSFDFH